VHFHLSAEEVVLLFLALLIVSAGWRIGAARLTNMGNPWGPAMQFVW
jgi:hypothetical protein